MLHTLRRQARSLTALFGLFVLLSTFTGVNILAAEQDNNIWWNQLGHNSRDALYRYPQGAVPAGTEVRLRFRAADGDLTSVDVRIWNDRVDQEIIVPMTRIASNVLLPNDGEPYEFWEATLPASAVSTVYWYRFILRDGTKTVYYEDDGVRTGGWGQPFDGSPDYSWQLTHYDPSFQTPDWVKNAVIYQIFVDRFRDGDPANNPAAGQFFYNESPTIFRSNDPEGDWNTSICDPRGNLTGNNCSGIYSQNFYGGDLQGVIDRLDYLQSLGVTAIYLNPIFESPSNHKYDTKDFFQIDDNFGDLATFQTLAQQANARGIRIILDGVFNHASSDSIYFDRYSRWDINGNPTAIGTNDGSGACESLSSPYVDWFSFFPYAGSGTAPCSDNRDYPKWFGIFDSLPVFQHDYPEVRDYFINNGVNSVGPYWMQWADGWRLDVAPEVDHGTLNDPNDDYWEDFRAAVHAVNPDAYIVGEEWGNPTSWTIDNQWDATMNYQFSSAVLSFWRDTAFDDNDHNSGSSAGILNPLSPSAAAERFVNLEERYAPEAFYAMMNLFGSHDTSRVLFMLDENAGSSNNTALFNDPNYDWADALSRLRGAVLMQMTMPGAPTIYYGDEVGTINPPSFDGSQWQDDPYNRVPYPWLDESGTPFYTHMQDASAQNAIFNTYATLTGIRNATPALRMGDFNVLMTDDANGIFAYNRQLADLSSSAIVLVNQRDFSQTATVNVAGIVPAGATLTDALNGGSVTIAADGNVTVNLGARSGAILTFGAFSTPDAVSDLQAEAQSGQVVLNWSAASGATGYDIYRSQISGGGYHFVGNTSDTSFTDATVNDGTPYFYVVESRDDALLKGGVSNEVTATPALSIGWANLQWPPVLTEVISATDLSGNIYGQIWIDGATNQPGATPGLMAQVGYGDSNDVNDGSWQWFDMTFNVDAGNNDEFMGNLPRTDTGTFCYTTRYSTDSAASWFYAVNGPDEGNPTCPGPFGVLNVVSSDDTTPPSAPTNLALQTTTDTSATLVWDSHPNTDGDLYGFRVYRDDLSDADGFVAVNDVVGAAATGYTDSGLTNGNTYAYYITALDAVLNESDASNTIEAVAELRQVDVTFNVTVPDFTPSVFPVHIVGSFNGWNPGDPAYRLTNVGDNLWQITMTVLDGTTFEYKFARGSWDRVEKQANGYDEVPNRNFTADYGSDGTQTVNLTVANWRDPIVTSFTPADGATDVTPNHVVTFSWSKWVPTPPQTVTITGPNGTVSGTFTWDDATLTHTFTPDNPLVVGDYTVFISGVANGGDVQQVPAEWTFSVPNYPPSVSLDLVYPEPYFVTEPVGVMVSASDANPEDAASLQVSIDCGNGTVINATMTDCVYASGGTYTISAEALDNYGGVGTDSVDVTILSVEGALDFVSGLLDGLYDDGTINRGQHNSLTTKLDQALGKYTDGKTQVAINQLTALNNQLADLIADGVLPADEGDALRLYVERIISAIQHS